MAPVRVVRKMTAKQRLAEIDKEKKRDSTSLKAVSERQKKRKRVMREYDEGPAGGREKRIKERMSRIEAAAKKLKRPTQSALDKMSFKKAFDEKRANQGAKTFTWRGKKYTTELAKPKAATTTTTTTTKPKVKPKGDGTTTTMQKVAKRKTLGSIVGGLRTGSRSKSLRSGAAGQKTTNMKSLQSRLIKQKERINRGKKVKINRNPKADYGGMKRGGRVRGRG